MLDERALDQATDLLDVALVQGGLTTTMELVAARRPFVYFPLAQHWEQQHFVTHRLNHYRAGLRMDYTTTTADDLATTMRAALAQAGTRPGYRKVPRGGAAPGAEEPVSAAIANAGTAIFLNGARVHRSLSLQARQSPGCDK